MPNRDIKAILSCVIAHAMLEKLPLEETRYEGQALGVGSKDPMNGNSSLILSHPSIYQVFRPITSKPEARSLGIPRLNFCAVQELSKLHKLRSSMQRFRMIGLRLLLELLCMTALTC